MKRGQKFEIGCDWKCQPLFESAGDGILIADSATRKIVYANRNASKMIGYSKKELLGMGVLDIHPKEALSLIKKEFKEASVGKITISNALPVLRKDGEIIYCDIGASLATMNGKDVAIGFFRDVTRRKKAERELMESEEKFRSLFDNMSSGVAVYEAVDNGKDFVFKDFNKAGCRIEGVKKKDVIGKKVTKVFPGVKKMGLFEVFHRVWKTGKPEDHPITMYKDERILGWRDNYVYKLPTGEIVAVYADVTKEKQVEEEVLRSKDKLDTVLSSMVDLIFEFDEKGVFTFYHAPGDGKLYAPPSAFIGKKYPEVLPPHLSKLIKKALIKNRKKQIDEFEYSLEIDGEVMWFSAKMSPAFVKNRYHGSVSVVRDITDRKKAEEKLKESEEKFRLIYETSSDAIMTLEPPSWRFTSGNYAIASMFGVKDEKEFTSLAPWQVSPKYQPDGQLSSVKAKKMIDKAMKKGSNFFEWTHKKVKGEEFFATVLLSKVKFRGKTFLQARVQDISEAKESEEKIKENEEELELITKNLNDAIFSKDYCRRYTFVNPMAAKIMGLPASKIIGHTAEELFSKEDAKIIKEVDDINFRGKNVNEIRSLMLTGDERFLRTVQTPIFGDNDKVVGITGVVHDLTEEKIIEKALEESEYKFRSLVDNIPNAAYTALGDKHGACTFMSGQWGDWTGYYPEDFYSNHDTWLKSVHPDDRKEALAKFVKAFSKKKPYAFEYKLQHRDTGKITHILDQGLPRAKKENGVVVYDGIATDITQLKQVERMKTEFVSVASHQLKTPLTGIKWFMELLLEGKAGDLNDKQKGYVNHAYASNERLIKLVADLLDVSRIEAGIGFELKKSTVDITKIIDQIIEERTSLMDDRKIQIIGGKGISKAIKLYVDKNKVKQVFYNLITNAVYFSGVGGKIEINCRKASGKMIFSVKDHGKGIPVKYQKKIFDKFFSVGEVIGESMTGGTGLGLYIAKTIVEAHKGEIWLKSKLGKGSTFYFSLPFKKS